MHKKSHFLKYATCILTGTNLNAIDKVTEITPFSILMFDENINCNCCMYVHDFMHYATATWLAN